MNCVLVCLLAFSQRSPLSWYGEHRSQAGWRETWCVFSSHVVELRSFVSSWTFEFKKNLAIFTEKQSIARNGKKKKESKFTYKVTDQQIVSHFLPFLAIFYILVGNSALQKTPKIVNGLALNVPSLKSLSLLQSSPRTRPPLRNMAGKIWDSIL